MAITLKTAIDYVWNGIARYALKFGVVGGIGFIIDVGIFNLLRLGVLGDDTWWQSPLGAKTVSVTVAIIFNWIGNRYWTFREHRRKNFMLELFEYAAVSVAGMLIQLACLYVSHYILGYQSLLADNISSNIVGMAIGTVFRFVLYRYWVYGHHRADGINAGSKLEEAELALFEEPPATTASAPLPDKR